jgi:hypothetical protein
VGEPEQQEDKMKAYRQYWLGGVLVASLGFGISLAHAAGFDFDGRAGFSGARPFLDIIRNQSVFEPAPVRSLPVPGFSPAEHRRGPWDGWRVKLIAHDLERASEELYYRYEERSRTSKFFEQISRNLALNALRNLIGSARHFHHQVESWQQDPEHTRQDFQRLMESYDKTRQAMIIAYHAGRVNQEYRRVTDLVYTLESYYRYGGGGQGEGWNWEIVKSLARNVEARAAHVHQEAERGAHHGDEQERRALADLHHLEREASHFRHQVESFFQDPSHTYRYYQQLLWAFGRADLSIRYTHAYGHVRQDFEAVGQALQQLDLYYRGSGGHGHEAPAWPLPRPGRHGPR